MNVTADQEKARMRRRRRARVGQEKRKRENRPPILRKLCAVLLRSFRGQHSEKIKGSARGNWDPREGQQPFRPNPNGVGGHAIMLRRLLIGFSLRWSLLFIRDSVNCNQFGCPFCH